MTEKDYTDRACSVSGCDGAHKAHGYCLRHYRQWRRGGIRADIKTCTHCGKSFEPFNAQAMYCSRACKLKAWKKSGPKVRVEALLRQEGQLFCVVYAEHCKACAKPFVSRQKKEYCDDACSGRRIGKDVKQCKCCGADFAHPVEARQAAFCSEACRLTTLGVVKRIQRGMRRARERSADAEQVDPIKVFERDRWRCQLCGVRTLRSKRGTMDDRAPELDHIIPLARGGAHTYLNTQCACKRCNMVKKAKPRGQLLLVG